MTGHRTRPTPPQIPPASKDEEHRILAENVEDYLGPIYRTEATFVIPLLSDDFPERIWTKFESEQFKDRFGEGAVIPIWYSGTPPSAFGEDRQVGGVTFDEDSDFDQEVARITDLLVGKIRERRLARIAAGDQLALGQGGGPLSEARPSSG